MNKDNEQREIKAMKKKPKFIIVDENSRPMSFHDYSEQLVYNSIRRRGNSFKVQTYTESEAKKVIKLTISNREKWGISTTHDYRLMPVNL